MPESEEEEELEEAAEDDVEDDEDDELDEEEEDDDEEDDDEEDGEGDRARLWRGCVVVTFAFLDGTALAGCVLSRAFLCGGASCAAALMLCLVYP